MSDDFRKGLFVVGALCLICLICWIAIVVLKVSTVGELGCSDPRLNASAQQRAYCGDIRKAATVWSGLAVFVVLSPGLLMMRPAWKMRKAHG